VLGSTASGRAMHAQDVGKRRLTERRRRTKELADAMTGVMVLVVRRRTSENAVPSRAIGLAAGKWLHPPRPSAGRPWREARSRGGMAERPPVRWVRTGRRARASRPAGAGGAGPGRARATVGSRRAGMWWATVRRWISGGGARRLGLELGLREWMCRCRCEGIKQLRASVCRR
jgi:hypothetical protein